MKLYTFHQSSSAYRVRIALHLKGLMPEMEYVNLTRGEQKSAAYAAVNTQMIVPTLIDKGETLSQSLAIMEYLEEAYPSPAILPKDLFARAHVRELALLVAADIAPLGNLKVRKYLPQFGLSEDDIKTRWIAYWIKDGLDAFEKIVAASSYTGAFCCGDTPTMADCCLVPQIFNARRWGVELSVYPTIMRIIANCEAHPAFIAAHPAQQKDAVK